MTISVCPSTYRYWQILLTALASIVIVLEVAAPIWLPYDIATQIIQTAAALLAGTALGVGSITLTTTPKRE